MVHKIRVVYVHIDDGFDHVRRDRLLLSMNGLLSHDTFRSLERSLYKKVFHRVWETRDNMTVVNTHTRSNQSTMCAVVQDKIGEV